MRRVLVVTWALGTASGVLLGLFGVQLVSSRFSSGRVSPLSHPEVLSALQAARLNAEAADQIALPTTAPPDTAVPPPSPPTDVAPARPSAGGTSASSSASRAGRVPRTGAPEGRPADTSVAAAVPSTTSTVTAPPPAPPPASTTIPPPTTPPTEASKPEDPDRRGPPSTSQKSTTTTDASKSDERSSRSGTETITSDGGVVVVKFSDGKVRYKMARPNSGYEVHVISYGPDYVAVYFDKGSKGYLIRAYYAGDEPHTDVTKCTGSWPRPSCPSR